jgi:UrcA family protein
MDYSKLASISAAVAITFGGLTVLAQPAYGKSGPVVVIAPSNIVSRYISYVDLNLANSAGELTLNRRVGGAVTGLCLEATGGDDRNFMTANAAKNCRNSAWAGARPQIARAVQRSQDIASTGVSSIAAAVITIALPQ